jgi:Phasin protein
VKTHPIRAGTSTSGLELVYDEPVGTPAGRSRHVMERQTATRLTKGELWGNGRQDSGTQENEPMDQNEQAARASEKAGKEFAEGVSRVKDAAARASDQSMRAGIEMFQRNAETVQHTIQSSAKLASTMAECSADQFGRVFGFSSGELTERSSRNMEAVVQSGTIVTEMMQRMCVECGDIARARMERGLKRMGSLVRSRSPQDIVALQSEILRDNLETFLGFARKAGEHSTRLVEEAQRRIESLPKEGQAA